MKTLLSAVLSYVVVSTSQAQITSTFDTDTDGWTFLDGAVAQTANQNASNCNP